MAARKKTTQKKEGTVEQPADLRGQDVSLVLTERTFFGIDSLWLSPDNPVGVIPFDISDQDLELVKVALAQGILKLGRAFYPPVEQDSATLEEFDKLVETTPMVNAISQEVKSKFYRLIRSGQSGGYSAYEIIQYCLNKEESRRAREIVRKFLKDSLAAYEGPKKLFSVPEGIED